eukprot:10880301-Lingulodinium_polyedra.AAC.1
MQQQQQLQQQQQHKCARVRFGSRCRGATSARMHYCAAFAIRCAMMPSNRRFAVAGAPQSARA